MTDRRRLVLFAAVALLAAAAIVEVVWRARSTAGHAPESLPRAAAERAAPPERPWVAVRSLREDGWGRVALLPLAAADGPRVFTPLSCLRVHIAGDRGICLATEASATPRHLATIFDATTFHKTVTLDLTGPPSRARMSRDGRFAAVTVFEFGHSYADAGFSTRTTIVDAETGTSLGDLEQFTVRRDGRPFARDDFNFWGVTFASAPGRFFATLAWADRPWLVEGDIARREVRVVAPDVECPSLSPDGTRIAFKRRDAGGFTWRLWTMRLATGEATPIAAESRSIDDQVEWLDDHQVLYQWPDDSGNHVWVSDVDAPTPARRFVPNAWSPAVVR